MIRALRRWSPNHLLALALAAGAAAPSSALAGTPENALLIIDPTNPVSLRVGNHYKTVRNIPDSHVLYMSSWATNWAEWIASTRLAFQDTLTQREIGPSIDYVILAPTTTFAIAASGLVNDGCSPVNRFSISSCYAMSQITSTIIPNTNVETINQVFSSSDTPGYFDASIGYSLGNPTTTPGARRYYIGALLGYTGALGNTAESLIAMIDRSVAVEGTRPAGTFYFMNNTADGNRNVRQPTFASTITALTNRGATATQLNQPLPTNRTDILGVMTGAANLNITTSGMTILPGAFCDHLTSYAGTLDSTSQTKMTVWIDQGASGTAGTVEEPCNYTGKFPHARLHLWYYQGMPLGAAYFRSLQYLPFQNLFYGDPLTRPFARIPVVSASGISASPARGTITITPSVTPAVGTTVFAIDLLIDGVLRQTITAPVAGRVFTFDTRTLSDGWHDVRVIARDATTARVQGRWIGSLVTGNFARSVALTAEPATGDLAQSFTFTPTVQGGTVTHTRLLQGSRVIAAGEGEGPLSVPGATLGAATTQVQVEVTYADGRIARSATVSVTVQPSGEPIAGPPVAMSYHKRLASPTVHVVELPAIVPGGPATGAIYSIVTPPAQATIVTASYNNAPYRFIRPNAGATGTDTLRFRIQTASGTSEGIVTLVYTPPTICLADFNVSGFLDPDDLADYIGAYFSGGTDPRADFNLDGTTDPDDLADYIGGYFQGC